MRMGRGQVRHSSQAACLVRSVGLGSMSAGAGGGPDIEDVWVQCEERIPRFGR